MSERQERPRRTRPVTTEERKELTVGRLPEVPKDPKPPIFNYEEDLHIDPNFLDAEWLNIANTIMKYSAESARAKKYASFAEERVKTLRSQLVKEANNNPSVMGKDVKATAPNVEAYYRDDEKYKEVKAEWIEAVYYADLMQNAVYAFQAKKAALENLVRLQGIGYNSEPQTPRDLPEAAQRFRELKERSIEERIRNRTNGKEN